MNWNCPYLERCERKMSFEHRFGVGNAGSYEDPLDDWYQIIYADPPWRYDFAETDSRKIENQYPTMELEEIKNMYIPSSDDCVLFLWATAPKIREALEVMNAWGFEYKTQMIWDKKIIGMGYWFRGQHEILMVGTKGNVFPPPQEKRISSIYREKRGKHSKKPDAIRRFIDGWYPNQRKLELFARDTFIGWDVYGNEASDIKQTYLHSIKEITKEDYEQHLSDLEDSARE